MTKTLRQAANHFFTVTHENGTYVDPVGKDRLQLHDILHTILNIAPGRTDNETLVGIFQAVLLRSSLVTKRPVPLEDGGEDLSFEAVQEKVLPGLEKFNQNLVQRFPQTVRAEVTREQMRQAFLEASILSDLIENSYGQRLGSIPIEKLKAIPANDMFNIVEDMRTIATADGAFQL